MIIKFASPAPLRRRRAKEANSGCGCLCCCCRHYVYTTTVISIYLAAAAMAARLLPAPLMVGRAPVMMSPASGCRRAAGAAVGRIRRGGQVARSRWLLRRRPGKADRTHAHFTGLPGLLAVLHPLELVPRFLRSLVRSFILAGLLSLGPRVIAHYFRRLKLKLGRPH